MEEACRLDTYVWILFSSEDRQITQDYYRRFSGKHACTFFSTLVELV
jgi:hypothetical protein